MVPPSFTEAVNQKCPVKKVFFKVFQNSQENTCDGISLIKLQACNVLNKNFLTKGFSCKFCKIFNSTSFEEHLWTATSAFYIMLAKSLFNRRIKLLALFSWKLTKGFKIWTLVTSIKLFIEVKYRIYRVQKL